MDLLHEEKEPFEWRSLHVGAERGVNCEHVQALLTKKNAETQGMAGRSPDRLAARILQIQYGLCGKLGREDGIPCGQALSGVNDSHLDRSPRTPDGCSVD